MKSLQQDLYMVQRADLATHLMLATDGNETAICGAVVGKYPSWRELIRYSKFTKGKYLSESGKCERNPENYVDCQRCAAILKKSK